MLALIKTIMQENERTQKRSAVRLVTLLGKEPSEAVPFPLETRSVIGVLAGAGIGREIIGATLHILKSVEQPLGLTC